MKTTCRFLATVALAAAVAAPALAEEQKAESGKSWFLGVHCLPAPAAVAAQLKIDKGKGVMVESVLPDSPAAKAGVSQYDVILKAGDQTIGTPEDLAAAVRNSGGKPLSLECWHAGEQKTIEVTPAERPAPAEADFPPGRPWNRFPLPIPDPEMDARFHRFGPGGALRMGQPIELPADMKVTITRQGKEPAEIVVEQGETSWKGTSDKLQGIPKEAEAWVRRALGTTPADDRFVDGPRRMRRGGAFPGQRLDSPEAVQKRIDESMKQLEELRRSVERLQKQDKASEDK